MLLIGMCESSSGPGYVEQTTPSRPGMNQKGRQAIILKLTSILESSVVVHTYNLNTLKAEAEDTQVVRSLCHIAGPHLKGKEVKSSQGHINEAPGLPPFRNESSPELCRMPHSLKAEKLGVYRAEAH